MFDLISKEFSLKKEQVDMFITFYDLLKEWNEKFNLTNITEENEVEIKHFYDSLEGCEFFPYKSNVIEIGSGGGFPSIPVMIKRNDLKFTLVEATGKKCLFLKEVIKVLGLNAEVLNKRAEEAGKDDALREKFDAVTARAVAKLNTLSEYCIPFIKKGGIFIAYKGNGEKAEEGNNAINILGCRYKETKNYFLPLNEGERNIFVFEKIKNTPLKYPRGNGKERNKPL